MLKYMNIDMSPHKSKKLFLSAAGPDHFINKVCAAQRTSAPHAATGGV